MTYGYHNKHVITVGQQLWSKAKKQTLIVVGSRKQQPAGLKSDILLTNLSELKTVHCIRRFSRLCKVCWKFLSIDPSVTAFHSLDVAKWITELLQLPEPRSSSGNLWAWNPPNPEMKKINLLCHAIGPFIHTVSLLKLLWIHSAALPYRETWGHHKDTMKSVHLQYFNDAGSGWRRFAAQQRDNDKSMLICKAVAVIMSNW